MKDAQFLMNNGIDVSSSLELLGDMQMYNETLKDFLEAVKDKVDHLKKYKEAADMANYAIIVHSLKSDAKYLGFTKLAELAYKEELESKMNNSLFIYSDFDVLMKEVDRILSVIHEYFGEKTSIENMEPKKIHDKKILVVDDSNIVCNLIQKMFEDEFEVLIATDGKVALDTLAMYSTNDLFGMLLDLNMPNVNGYTVLEYFKTNDLFKNIPVAIITGDDSKENLDKVFTYTIVDVLPKPFNEKNIRRVINAMQNFQSNLN